MIIISKIRLISWYRISLIRIGIVFSHIQMLMI